MINNPICIGGCLVNPSFSFVDVPNLESLFKSSTVLTTEEKDILKDLSSAWNKFVALDNKSQDDIIEFKDSIHNAQKLIALRIARRNNPEIWNCP